MRVAVWGFRGEGSQILATRSLVFKSRFSKSVIQDYGKGTVHTALGCKGVEVVHGVFSVLLLRVSGCIVQACPSTQVAGL